MESEVIEMEAPASASPEEILYDILAPVTGSKLPDCNCPDCREKRSEGGKT